MFLLLKKLFWLMWVFFFFFWVLIEIALSLDVSVKDFISFCVIDDAILFVRFFFGVEVACKKKLFCLNLIVYIVYF